MKAIPWFDWYRATIDWEIYSTRVNSEPRIIKWMVNNKWYRVINLRKDGKYKRMLVHRLIAMTYIENFNNKQEVNHKDTVTSNNAVDNLEWCTRTENVRHTFTMWYKGSSFGKKGKDHPRSKRVIQKDLLWNIIQVHNWISEACRSLNMKTNNISLVIKWDRNHSWWYKREYA